MISPESTRLHSLVWIELQLLTGSAEAGGMCTKHFLQETNFNVVLWTIYCVNKMDVCSQSENLLVAQKHTLVLNRQGSGNNETILFYLRSRRLSETISLFPTLLTRVQTASLTSWNMYESGHDTALAPESTSKFSLLVSCGENWMKLTCPWTRKGLPFLVQGHQDLDVDWFFFFSTLKHTFGCKNFLIFCRFYTLGV